MKAWEKPQLIVLVRSAPGERVLDICKSDTGGASALSVDIGCLGEITAALIICEKCFSPDVS